MEVSLTTNVDLQVGDILKYLGTRPNILGIITKIAASEMEIGQMCYDVFWVDGIVSKNFILSHKNRELFNLVKR